MKRMGWLMMALGLACWAGEGDAGVLKIVATTSDLADLARTVAGDKAVVSSICAGREDPHTLQAKPSFIVRARDADLWIRIGLELEIGWEMPVLDGARNARIRPGSLGHLDASEGVRAMEIPQSLISRAMGDVHPMGNPHYWLDPYNGRRIAGAIAERLAQIRPSDAAFFRANATAFQKTLDARMFGAELVGAVGADVLWAKTQDGTLAAFLDASDHLPKVGGWVGRLWPLRGQSLVTYHKSWVYFAQCFGLKVVAEVEPQPGVPPTAAHLTRVLETMRAAGVAIVLQEPFYSTKAARQLADKTGARVVVVANAVGGEPAAKDYMALMDLIVTRLATP